MSETQVIEKVQDKKLDSVLKRRFFDAVFVLGYICALIPGPFPQFTTVASILLVLCIAVSFFDDNFYLYLGIFIYLRYRLLIGDTPAFRLYSYLLVMKFLCDITKVKFRIAYLPALFVFTLHSIFALPRLSSLRIGLNVIVDCALAYIVLLKLLQDGKLMRKFIFVFMLGGIASGIYGWTNKSFAVDINVAGAGAHTVKRNFGALSDANFAGLFYSLCIICAIVIKNVPLWLKCVFLALFAVMLLETASLSALLILSVLATLYIILKYRGKSIFILSGLLVALVLAVTVILSIPQLRQIDAIAGLIFRVSEKLSYIPRGRWDLLTTDRSAIWGEAMSIFSSKSLWGKLIGGSVITVMFIDYSVISIACHNSYLQSLLNFGVLGTLLIYIPLLLVFSYRMLKHFTQKSGYGNEDIRMLQLIFSFAFIVFGMTVDFFIDWPFMLLYFI
ncbi:MAG: hypothetical protein IJZ81_03325 [Clostridia bacterium]|nr:hypothetical protein [Clostridia bacterium]